MLKSLFSGSGGPNEVPTCIPCAQRVTHRGEWVARCAYRGVALAGRPGRRPLTSTASDVRVAGSGLVIQIVITSVYQLRLRNLRPVRSKRKLGVEFAASGRSMWRLSSRSLPADATSASPGRRLLPSFEMLSSERLSAAVPSCAWSCPPKLMLIATGVPSRCRRAG